MFVPSTSSLPGEGGREGGREGKRGERECIAGRSVGKGRSKIYRWPASDGGNAFHYYFVT